MQWYIPMTIIPGIGLLLLSTSNLMLGLNNELIDLERKEECKVSIINAKLKQLKRLSIAMVFLYIGVLFFLTSGVIITAITKNEVIVLGTLILGVISVMIAIMILINYSLRAIKIRQERLRIE